MTDQARQFNTPMMQQYLKLKKQYQDCILLFRLGDFYEMFLDDAILGAEILDITLTARSRGQDGKIPMAGVPYHSIDNYLIKLVEAGLKVAIAEQITEPDGKGLVEREVVKIITPGTLLIDKNIKVKTNNYCLNINLSKNKLGLSLADLSTGDLYADKVNIKNNLDLILNNLITKFNPSECVLDNKNFKNKKLVNILNKFNNLKIFEFDKKLINSLDFLKKYLEFTQKQKIKYLKKAKKIFTKNYLELDANTIRNLELISCLRTENFKNTFLYHIDYTKTAMGARSLKDWLLRPSINLKIINSRLEQIAKFKENYNLRKNLQKILKQISDIERLIAKLSLNTANPRDLKNLQNSLENSVKIFKLLKIKININNINKIIKLINNIILAEPKLDTKSGGIIQNKINTKLDKLRKIKNNSKNFLANLEKQERQKTGINSLKIKFNKIFGFYIDVSKANLKLVPKNYQRKQTLVNSERFITKSLKKHEEIILSAEEKINKLEFEIFSKLIKQILIYTLDLQLVAKEIAKIDCLAGLAQLAFEKNFTKPKMIDNGELKIIQGRHLVVENNLGSHNFVLNDLYLNQTNQQLILLTGPNMAGKSVLMRQTALIVLLAHMGSFVPAKKASLSLTDQIFVRSGASDRIADQQSTFMLEMLETAYILNHATKRSLIIMDEIGRGTSTYDGISIAVAIAEELIKNKQGPKTLFATHYHELQDLEKKFRNKIKNFNMQIKKYKQKLYFLYKLRKGGAKASFGINAAKMAGLPQSVIKRANKLLKIYGQN